ncbi:MAG TPA: TetR/AcrR family transcriptional regulator C-terminal domain-containing protein [Anaerovoracaceae bacterium]|nr:TetR/AcrR family transcriptional regulator C-terminal domain-containing protein [Anaerovoracaceae bacterium]
MSLKLNVKEIFMKSLLELSQEKPVEKITVQNILDHSGAARQTFYNYFTDKYDLINYVYQYEVESFFNKYYVNLDLYECIHRVYVLFIKSKQFYKHIAKMESQNSFKKFLYDNTRNFYISTIQKKFGKDEINDRLTYIIDFTCHGAVGLCIHWIMNDMKETPEEMTSRIIDCIHPEMKKYFIEQLY